MKKFVFIIITIVVLASCNGPILRRSTNATLSLSFYSIGGGRAVDADGRLIIGDTATIYLYLGLEGAEPEGYSIDLVDGKAQTVFEALTIGTTYSLRASTSNCEDNENAFSASTSATIKSGKNPVSLYLRPEKAETITLGSVPEMVLDFGPNMVKSYRIDTGDESTEAFLLELEVEFSDTTGLELYVQNSEGELLSSDSIRRVAAPNGNYYASIYNSSEEEEVFILAIRAQKQVRTSHIGNLSVGSDKIDIDFYKPLAWDYNHMDLSYIKMEDYIGETPNWTKLDPSQGDSATISGLDSETIYLVRMSPRDSNGNLVHGFKDNDFCVRTNASGDYSWFEPIGDPTGLKEIVDTRILTYDLDLSDEEWEPLDKDTEFQTLIGNGYEITGLNISTIDGYDIGLFSRLYSGQLVSGISLIDVDIATNYCTGALVGYVHLGEDDCVIYSCSSSGRVTNTEEDTGGLIGRVLLDGTGVAYVIDSGSSCEVNGTSNSGGLVGGIKGGYFYGCSASGHVTVSDSTYLSNFADAGGFVGCVEANTMIANCSSSGSLTISAIQKEGMDFGGFAGSVYPLSAETITISRSSARGNVTVDEVGINPVNGKPHQVTYIGGFVGNNYGNISECFSTGDVTGIITIAGDTIGGGFAGFMNANSGNPSEISNCYSTGRVEAYTHAGGFIGMLHNNLGTDASITYCYSTGYIDNLTEGAVSIAGFAQNYTGQNIKNCYWDTASDGPLENNGGVINGGASRLTTVEMQNKDSFTGWNFETVWDIKPTGPRINGGYPFLRNNRP